MTRPLITAAVLAMLAVAALFGFDTVTKQADERRAREELIPAALAAIESNSSDYAEAFALAREAARLAPGDPEVAQILQDTSLSVEITTEPLGVDVFVQPYADPGAPWEHLGATPLPPQRLAVTVYRWRFDRAGFVPVDAAEPSWNVEPADPNAIVSNRVHRVLEPLESAPEGMVLVAETQAPEGVIPAFHIDRTEVTNAQYKRFVDAGGYVDPQFWRRPVIIDGEALSHADALTLFLDRSGQPGPEAWIAGTFTDGTANLPVTGISWYEAAAYAAFAGRKLPTSAHFDAARGAYRPMLAWPQRGGLALLEPFSNFSGDGPVRVGSQRGITAYGAHDMAGNVREWTYNKIRDGRVVRGGAFNDDRDKFVEPSLGVAHQRYAGTGFRTAIYDAEDPAVQALHAPAQVAGQGDG